MLVSSFAADTVAKVRAADPSVPAAGHAALNPFVTTVDAALVTLAHDAGLAVNVWTVDDPEAIASLAALGVDGIVTNEPDVARSVLG